MNYKQEYEEALERAKKTLESSSANEIAKTVVYYFFPELTENEDERIRKAIGAAICGAMAKSILEANGTNLPDALAYLEKQKEKGRNITANLLEDGITGVQRELIEFLANNIDASWVDVIKSAEVYAQRIRSMFEKQKKQWSEEDVDMLNSCISSIEEAKENRYAYKETDGDTSPEQPEVDLKKEVTKFVLSKEYIEGKEPPVLLTARHFYELGCRYTAVMYDDIEHERQRAEEAELSEGLDAEMDKYFESMEVLEHENIFEDTFHKIARHFAEWGAEHLKK